MVEFPLDLHAIHGCLLPFHTMLHCHGYECCHNALSGGVNHLALSCLCWWKNLRSTWQSSSSHGCSCGMPLTRLGSWFGRATSANFPPSFLGRGCWCRNSISTPFYIFAASNAFHCSRTLLVEKRHKVECLWRPLSTQKKLGECF